MIPSYSPTRILPSAYPIIQNAVFSTTISRDVMLSMGIVFATCFGICLVCFFFYYRAKRRVRLPDAGMALIVKDNGNINCGNNASSTTECEPLPPTYLNLNSRATTCDITSSKCTAGSVTTLESETKMDEEVLYEHNNSNTNSTPATLINESNDELNQGAMSLIIQAETLPTTSSSSNILFPSKSSWMLSKAKPVKAILMLTNCEDDINAEGNRNNTVVAQPLSPASFGRIKLSSAPPVQASILRSHRPSQQQQVPAPVVNRV